MWLSLWFSLAREREAPRQFKRFCAIGAGRLARFWRARTLASSVLLLAILLTSFPKKAQAYTWMIGRGYQNCAQCHSDPSGGGPLTAYGRALAEVEMRSDLLLKRDEEGSLAPFLLGLAKVPDQVHLGGDLRVMELYQKLEATPATSRLIWMQADLSAAVEIDRFVASGSIGYADTGALGAALSRDTESNVVSRHHWLGAWLDAQHQLLLRAGRMNLPYGIRGIEHTLWTRVYTATNIDDQQQTGLALAYAGSQWRAELMGIYGNLQLRPAEFRDRGYSAYAELFPSERLALGVSSKLTHADLDTRLLKEIWRHAHGISLRWATPLPSLVVLGEADYVLQSAEATPRRTGVVGYVQADFEVLAGMHLIATGEARNVGVDAPPLSWGTWLSYAWFFLPHADLRLDAVYQSIGANSGAVNALALLAQAHVYL